MRRDPINLADPEFGAVIGQDNTAAFDAAYAKARAENRSLFIPSAGNGEWRYNGAGFPQSYVPVIGEGSGKSRIRLGDGVYLFDIAEDMGPFHVEGLSFWGGEGLLRHTWAGVNVHNWFYVVKDCVFQWYMGACISSDAADMPYWRITGNVFEGRSYDRSMGVALPGPGTDLDLVTDNSFTRNLVSLKIRGGSNLKVRDNDFIRYTRHRPAGPAVDVWVAPVENPSSTVKGGTGFESSGNKYGNENIAPGDFRILIAPEGEGAGNGTRFPNYDVDATAPTTSIHSHNDSVFGANIAPTPFVRANIVNIHGGVNVTDLSIGGTPPTEIVQYRDPSKLTPSNVATGVVGSFHGSSVGFATVTPAMSNGFDHPYLIDPEVRAAQFGTVPAYAAGDPGGYRNRLPQRDIRRWTPSGTLKPITDSTGGENAALFTPKGAQHAVDTKLDPFTPGRLVWLELDLLAVGSAGSATVEVHNRPASGQQWAFTRFVRLDQRGGWERFRFPFLPRIAGENAYFIVRSADGGTIALGRPAAYEAREPQQDAVFLTSRNGSRFRLVAGDDGSLSLEPA